MIQDDDTKVICIKSVELERIIRNQEVNVNNAFDLHMKYERCFDCVGYGPACDFFKSQYLLGKSLE